MKRQLGRNLKKSLRKCYNSLRRDGLTSRMEVLDTPDAIDGAMDDFFRLHAERAELGRTLMHPNVFSTPKERAFLAELCHRLADRGVARVYRLWVDGQIVAIRISFQMGQSLCLYYSGWKSTYGRYSVMTRLLAEIIQDAIAR